MKLIDVCRGCGARRLVNHLRLCKRCNKEASKYLSQSDIDKARMEREALVAAKAKMKEAEALEKAQAEAEKAEAEAEEGKEEEGEKKEKKEGERKAEEKAEKK